jgi:3-oxoacyl-[acyl-carrier protein] reductase
VRLEVRSAKRSFKCFNWLVEEKTHGEGLQDKVALVTGSSRGIGRSIALELASQGADVCVNFSKNRESALKVADEIQSMGRKTLVIGADVTSRAQVENLVRQRVSGLGRIDVLVNNAGIIHFSDNFLESEKEFLEMFNVNLMGPFFCMKEAAKYMIEQKSGKIVNIASVAGIGISETGSSGYAVTKAALIMMTRRLGIELGPYEINVNCVAPGYIKTDMAGVGKTLEEEAQQEKRVAGITMLRRVAMPEEVATVVAFLASPDSDFICGQTITVDGGKNELSLPVSLTP